MHALMKHEPTACFHTSTTRGRRAKRNKEAPLVKLSVKDFVCMTGIDTFITIKYIFDLIMAILITD